MLLSQTYPKEGIKEDVAVGYVEFYVAGYTKQYNGTDLQPIHANIYKSIKTAIVEQIFHDGPFKKKFPRESASYLECGTDSIDHSSIEFPLDAIGMVHAIDLIPEPTNKFDPNAILVQCTFFPSGAGKKKGVKSYILGYVPKLINKDILKAMGKKQLLNGKVKKSIYLAQKGLVSTKVAIYYNTNNVNFNDDNRIQLICESLDE